MGGKKGKGEEVYALFEDVLVYKYDIIPWHFSKMYYYCKLKSYMYWKVASKYAQICHQNDRNQKVVKILQSHDQNIAVT